MRNFVFFCFCLASTVLGLYDSGGSVEVLSAEDFKQKVTSSPDTWLIEFYADWCGHCQSFVPEYKKVASVLKGVIRVGAVSDESVIQKNGVKGFPTVQIFAGAPDKKKSVTYDGERTVEGIVDFTFEKLRKLVSKRLKPSGEKSKSKTKKEKFDSVLIDLKSDDFDEALLKHSDEVWFVMFYAPWCGHCKNLEPTWREVANKMHRNGKVKIARVDATEEKSLASRFGIQGFPTLIAFPVTTERTAAGLQRPQNSGVMRKYDGPRDLTSMTFFLETMMPANPVDQLVSDSQFQGRCKSTLCVISFLPHVLEVGEDKRAEQIAIIQSIQNLRPGNLEFFWSQGGDQFDLEEALQLKFGFPALIMINLNKESYLIHKGSFSKDSIISTLDRLTSGSLTVDPLPSNLLIKTIKQKAAAKDEL
eukprot:GHVP01041636.1.p1 GENE.GHVP01041636.1~~GHVP01041636.1.p1  ORF type:complete len:418 (+),score=81.13 GHVP01041636.1:18-1271(+)